MIKDYPEEILITLQKPSRYLGREPHFPYKDWERADLKVCLGYPDLYEVGRSHLGINILAGIINASDRYLCDFVFAVYPDMEKALKEREIPLLSLNYKRPLREFDVLGISYPYELLVTNLFQILELSGIPFKAEEREKGYPLIIGGGPCCGNPEPIAELFDAIVIGDAEEVILEILKLLENWKTGSLIKSELYVELTKIEGLYVPLLKNKVKRRLFIPKGSLPMHYSIPVIPLAHDRVSLEISRGCTRSCRFCEAGFYYRPVREKSPQEILEEAKRAFNLTGYREASLMSLSAGDYSCLEELVDLLEKEFYSSEFKEFVFSLPSLRVGSLTPKILNFLKKGRTSTLTIAVEAASERLRRVINKNIDMDALFRDVELAKIHGFKRLKLYFMLGLPTETEEDLWEMTKLYSELKKSFKGGEILFSASIFIPKPHTPFQWERQITLEEAFAKVKVLKDKLRDKFKAHNPKQSLLEGVIARSGQELFSYLQSVYKKGARLDSWKEFFDYTLWEETARELGLELRDYLSERDPLKPLPWEHIDLGVKKEFLLKERKRAYEGKYTSDCRFEPCVKCGVCKGKIKNYLARESQVEVSQDKGIKKSLKTLSLQKEVWYEIYFDKKGPAKFLSQLEVLRLFELYLRREGFSLAYTQGFNPRPKFVCSEATSVGIEVEGEFLGIAFREDFDEKLLLGREIYRGLKIVKVKGKGFSKPLIPERGVTYLLELKKNLKFEPLKEDASTVKIEELRDKNLIQVIPLKGGFSILKFLRGTQGIANPLEVFRILKIYN
jgi:radical SAM superfamily enzyme YgiQ (UPF0313 family)